MTSSWITESSQTAQSRKISPILSHDDVIKWKLFPCYWPFVRGIHRSPVDSPQKSQWRGDLLFVSSAPEQTRANNRDTGDFRRHRVHYYVTVINFQVLCPLAWLLVFRAVSCWVCQCWGPSTPARSASTPVLSSTSLPHSTPLLWHLPCK